MKNAKKLGYALGLPTLLVVFWWIATVGSTNFFVPKPGELVGTFVDVWIGDRFINDVLPSLYRLALGIVISIVGGIIVGLLIGSIRWLRAFAEPVLEFLRAIPPPVLVPILMLIVGIGGEMQVLVIISGAIWPVLLNTVEGVRAVDSVLSETSRSYAISGPSRVRYLVLPSACPQIMTGVRQCLSLALILMVISEMFASSSGLGFTIVQFQRSFAIPEMWSGIATLGLIGVTLAAIFHWFERRILAWYHGLREVENAS